MTWSSPFIYSDKLILLPKIKPKNSSHFKPDKLAQRLPASISGQPMLDSLWPLPFSSDQQKNLSFIRFRDIKSLEIHSLLNEVSFVITSEEIGNPIVRDRIDQDRASDFY